VDLQYYGCLAPIAFSHSQVPAKNIVLFHLVPVPLAIELHLFFPRELALGLALSVPVLDALVFSAGLGTLVAVCRIIDIQGMAIFLFL